MKNVVFAVVKHTFLHAALYRKNVHLRGWFLLRPRGRISTDVVTSTMQNARIAFHSHVNDVWNVCFFLCFCVWLHSKFEACGQRQRLTVSCFSCSRHVHDVRLVSKLKGFSTYFARGFKNICQRGKFKACGKRQRLTVTCFFVFAASHMCASARNVCVASHMEPHHPHPISCV